MIRLRTLLTLPAVFALAGGLSLPAQAQQRWPPDSTENLQVLPRDISIRDLVQTMRGFAGALGVRCTHCHVGDDPNDLGSVDFPSDEKIQKRKAREMIRIRDRINEQLLATLPERSDPPVVVQCWTCHRGSSKPTDIRDILVAKLEEGGAAAVIAEYDALREMYYGSWTYDFREFTLVGVAERTMVERPDEALAVLDHNLTYYPESAGTYTMKAQILANLKDDFDGAIEMVREAQRVRPGVPRFGRMIEQLEAARTQAAAARDSSGAELP